MIYSQDRLDWFELRPVAHSCLLVDLFLRVRQQSLDHPGISVH